MAKVVITGQALVVTSTISKKDIELVAKTRPQALTLWGGEDGKEPLYSIGVGKSNLNAVGATFGETTRDDAKLASMTMLIDYNKADVVDYVAEKYGASLAMLNKLEATLPGVIAEVKAEREAIRASITVAG